MRPEVVSVGPSASSMEIVGEEIVDPPRPSPPSSSSTPPTPTTFILETEPQPQQQHQTSGFFARIRSSVMESLEKRKLGGVRVEYTEIPSSELEHEEQGVETVNGEPASCSKCGQPSSRHGRGGQRKKGLWKSWGLQLRVTVLGVGLLALILLLNLLSAIKDSLIGARHNDYDPFVNWGQPNTGTEDLSWYPTDFLRDVIPLPCHSHNDYWRRVPLFDALYAGCTGVEADVWLFNNDLLVGHDLASLQVNRTFQSLYVNPIVDILEKQNPKTPYYNGTLNGVFDVDPAQTLVLLIDLKTSGHETWPHVLRQLDPLRERGWLSFYEDGEFRSRPVTVVGTGNTPFDLILTPPYPTTTTTTAKYSNPTSPPDRDAFFDAPLDKLLTDSPYNSSNSYYASVSFFRSIGITQWWKGGEPTAGQLAKIRGHLAAAKERGLVSRYWELPAWPIHVRNKIWEVLVGEGMGMLNVDDLKGATSEDWRRIRTWRRILRLF
ncbi:hypothetical protein QC764_202230 [Podospora pseudoanserina]|uniref:Altered inheritance of mitochondria protein 6 n=1 Tax=Podospora pseudoanserina TaxID=2609844 RepID=A0ABR0IFU9_9PEZI|nr:hypothetical protein QC764_202230 [Podospora pseudoanserina]